MELQKLAWDLGTNVSYHVPGGTPHDLSKEGVIMRIIEKRFSTVQTETIMQAIMMQVQEAVVNNKLSPYATNFD